MSKQYLVRLIASSEHEIPRSQLVETIRKTGKDYYDPKRSQLFSDYYGKYQVDFFAERAEAVKLETKIAEMRSTFPDKSLGDRGRSVNPDIAVIYDASKCEMIKHVYPGSADSDCYRFIGEPKDALVEVRIFDEA